jgi:hypothetical protein
VFGALVAAAGYPLGWAMCGIFPLLAVPLVPVAAMQREPETRWVESLLRKRN